MNNVRLNFPLVTLVNKEVSLDWAYFNILFHLQEAMKTITSYCKPRTEVISSLGYNIIDNEPGNIDQGEEITNTIETLKKRIEVSENGANVLQMK